MLAIPPSVLSRLRLTCLDLPEVAEETAWVGVRWVVAKKNFAHVLMIDGGHPPAYAKAAGSNGPLCVLTFRGPRPEIDAPRFKRAPFFRPPWFDNIAAMTIGPTTDWDEVQHLLVRSYRVQAPRRLRETTDRAGLD